MDCTLATLIACFSWSGLYVDSGVSIQDRGDTYFVTAPEYFERPLTNGVVESGTEVVTREIDVRRNPYGRFALGYQVNIGSLVLSIEASHKSSLDTSKDRGINSLGISARWFPFR
jgi:hypothetical protein